MLERARRCWRAHRDFEELGDFKDLGDFCRTLLMMSGRARAMNRVINLIVDYVDHQLELFFSLFLFHTLNWCDFYQLFSFVCASNSQAPGSPSFPSHSMTQDRHNRISATESSSHNLCNKQTNATITIRHSLPTFRDVLVYLSNCLNFPQDD